MAFVYHRYFHLLNDNGNKELVDEISWGSKRLTGSDLAQYESDMEQAFTPVINAINAGNIVLEDLEEEITLESGQKLVVKIGEKVTFPGATAKFEFHANFIKWAEVMKKDPNLSYKDPAWIDTTV